jgi:hypothetical protein
MTFLFLNIDILQLQLSLIFATNYAFSNPRIIFS